MMLKIIAGIAAVWLGVVAQTASASAGPSWDEIRASVFGSRPIEDGHGVVTFDAPTRPEDMRVVPFAVTARLTDGRFILSVTILIEENPTPVVAVFRMGPGREDLKLKSSFRVDRQSDARVVVEVSDGQLYMVSRLIKYAGGQSSCSAPPTGDPVEIAANMGKISLTHVKTPDPASSSSSPTAELVLRHPNHTGMVMDQQTLLYTPMKMVSEIDVLQDGELVFSAAGSIALSQDPKFQFNYDISRGTDMTVTFKDTDGGTWTQKFPLGPQG